MLRWKELILEDGKIGSSVARSPVSSVARSPVPVSSEPILRNKIFVIWILLFIFKWQNNLSILRTNHKKDPDPHQNDPDPEYWMSGFGKEMDTVRTRGRTNHYATFPLRKRGPREMAENA